jgi:ATP-binding cassette subfamily C protein LapB
LDRESERRAIQALQSHVKADDILLISTHRPALAAHLANRVIVMQGGEVVDDGRPERVIPQVMQQQSPQRDQAQARMPGAYNLSAVNKGPMNVV